MAAKKATGKAAPPPSPEQEADSPAPRKVNYSVLVHTDDQGFEVFEPIAAGSGDEAAQIALEKKSDDGASVRGGTPYSETEA